MLRTLPVALNLEEACQRVISSNKDDGYPPNNFFDIVNGKYGRVLVDHVSKLIVKADTVERIQKLIKTNVRLRNLLTIEDYIQRFGSEWGFEPPYVEAAKFNVQQYDQSAGYKRY